MLTNTDVFRQDAIYFKKHKQYDCGVPGTLYYKEWWDERERRCKEGYEVDGVRVTGYHYFYLNFCPIIKINEDAIIDPKVKKVAKIKDFPSFWDIDYKFFHAVDRAETEGKHLVVLKARGKGFSFKLGSMGCRNFFLIPDSKSYYMASEKEYLIRDGILTKAWDYMDFIDEFTDWSKRRHVKNDMMHKRASYLEAGGEIERGYKSEIIGVTMLDNPDHIRGKRGQLMIFEEGGKFPKLKNAWQICRSSVEQGGYATGILIAFGTGGSEGNDFEGIEEMFRNPEAYNALAFDNEWDPGQENTKCGYFVPCYEGSDGFMDKDGNSNVEDAKTFFETQRELIKKTAKDPTAIDRYCAENPFTVSEACLRFGSNIFPIASLNEQLTEIQVKDIYRDAETVCDLIMGDNGKVDVVVNHTLKPIYKYPLSKTDDPTGAIVIYYHPDDKHGAVPYGRFLAGLDPYDQDKAAWSSSLGSCIIYDKLAHRIVAEYSGRPKFAHTYYENVRKLLLYYNAVCLYENEKPGIFQYFLKMGSSNLLMNQPMYIKDVIPNSTVNRQKGLHAVQAIRDHGEILLRDWLNEEPEPGIPILKSIRCEPLLKELISYNDSGNFDRVDAMIMLMYAIQETHKQKILEGGDLRRQDPFFSRRMNEKARR